MEKQCATTAPWFQDFLSEEEEKRRSRSPDEIRAAEIRANLAHYTGSAACYYNFLSERLGFN